ncbi:hypothetical protein HMPREF9607_00921 [Cutibacterium modestum HL044PA1]|uniref:Carbohydrate kinase PfkB domain-containing protein n=1 Tax=Cutibacterium modestum HL044PA1 TaxID=765109 RepID=A0ABP2K7I0_9ACTN|nr:hypothetical protein HMPREF9607_00921 [Cutibacterium modestum HL044PA1]
MTAHSLEVRVSGEQINVVDTVGAGDSFISAAIDGVDGRVIGSRPPQGSWSGRARGAATSSPHRRDYRLPLRCEPTAHR